jgi:outer membrane receptor protein involved in Fe transport
MAAASRSAAQAPDSAAGAPPAAPAPSPAAVPPPNQPKVITLNPFEVQSDRDSGYYAPNTLAGTRINSKVEDLGASITVVTKQQLLDTAALDLNDIFKYEANTEGIFNYTAQNSSAPTNDTIQSSPQGATRIRGIGTPNLAINNFVMTSRIPVDTYDLESVEISRGPNSTLFGLGNPSGTVNLNTLKANVTRDFNSLAFRVDNFGSWRTNLDINRRLWKDRVALRIAAVDSERKYERKPSYDNVKRLYATATIKPFEKTTLHLIYEHFKENRQTPNYLTPRDGVTEWLNHGRPTWNPLNYSATVNGTIIQVPASAENTPAGGPGALPPGLYSNNTNYTRPSMYLDGGQVQLWEINRLGTSTNPNAGTTSNVRTISGSGSAYTRADVNGGVLYQTPGISNQALYDWTKFNAVSPDWNYDHASLYTIDVEQQLIPDMFIRGAWHLEDGRSFNRNIVNPPLLQVDVNQFLLDGRANPFFLRPFYQVSEPTITQSPEYNDNTQVQLTYDLNFEKLTTKRWTRWLGEHRMLAYYEGRHVTSGTFRNREATTDTKDAWEQPPYTINGGLSNGIALNRPTYRYYVGPQGAIGFTPNYTPPKSGVQGQFNFQYNRPDGSFVSDPSNFGLLSYTSSQTRQEIVSRGAVIQSSFLDDRVVFTGGLRKDFTRTRNSNVSVVDGVTGLWDNAPISTWLPWTNATGTTRTLNLVVKPFRWLGLFAEKSTSFVPQPQAINIYGNVLPNTYAHGQDVGGYLSFFNNKLVVRLSLYKNTIVNDRNSDSTIGGRIISLENDLSKWALGAAQNKLGATGTPEVVALVNGWTKYPPFLQQTLDLYNAGVPVRGTNNTEAKGGELSIDYNPSYNLNFKFSGSQTKAVPTSLETDLSDFLALRMPTYLAATDGTDPFWTSTKYYSQSASNFFTTSVSVPIELAQALLGKSNPQVKEYSWRALANYRFTEGWFKNFSLGGDVRWDGRSSIGYLAAPADADGIVRHLDVNRSAYDPARYSGDMFTSYSTKLDHGKVGLRVQLNWNQAFVTGGLRVTAVNPDGQPYNYRIIDPQQFILTTTFSF